MNIADNKRLKKFDENFAERKRQLVIVSIVSLVVSGGLVGFGVWAIVKVMQHFGVIG